MVSVIHDRIADDIAHTGRSVICVASDLKSSPAFVYTVGNHLHGLPELLMIGWSHTKAGAVLNAISDMAAEVGRAFNSGEEIDVGGDAPLKVIDTSWVAKEFYTIQAGEYLETQNYRVQQLIVPDHAGRFPGDPQCARPYRDQLILGVN